MSTDEGANSAADAAEEGELHKNAAQDVIAVDADDNEQGLVNRLDAHTGDGTRHRAFTCLVFDGEGRLLLAQRAPTKRLWDTSWDGTVASHPVEGQSQVDATAQRLEEELGITPDQYGDLRVTDKFEYKRYYENAGLEWEVCAVLKVTLDDTTLDPDEEEIAGLLWVDYEHLHEHPQWYRQLRLCPWFEIAMRRDFEDESADEPSQPLN
ncbi:NUDIX hydrolase [Halogeometricum luteum]|uniref:Isopentenyl-diphosphate Delta-isomerase n=1 Tax=Halogeometricum luteum TaxID=2950537 RepID=A0ABU2G2E4_9EURY|nr:NUDIX domain-containing protein [Halogeometricum sp. S3BR5-2]MDS0294484.1 NUDIX domain-containing protein [Halogeometricum sp. S3BR5-2]